MLRSLENAYSQLYSKLFHTFDKNIIKQCQYYFGQLPIEFKIANRRFNFLSKMHSIDNIYCRYFDVKNDELLTLVNTYCYVTDDIVSMKINIEGLDRIKNMTSLLRKHFERSLQIQMLI